MSDLFFDKVANLRPEILLKQRFPRSFFPVNFAVNFAKFLRTPSDDCISKEKDAIFSNCLDQYLFKSNNRGTRSTFIDVALMSLMLILSTHLGIVA